MEPTSSGPAHPTLPDPTSAAATDPSPPPAATPATPPVPIPPTSVPSALPAAPQPIHPTPTQDSTAKPGAPAAQVAPVLLSLARSSGGTQHLTIRLDPPELGAVQIRVQQSGDAPARIEISVQRPETLDLMLRDQPSLQHTLDQAGVPVEGRHLVFQLDPQTQPGAGDNTGGHDRGTPNASTTAEPEDDQDDPVPAAQVPPRWTRAGLDITA
ncbi:MAG TPA: flagellar hook-length control protein FliK [Acetobacteraceae bacterium]